MGRTRNRKQATWNARGSHALGQVLQSFELIETPSSPCNRRRASSDPSDNVQSWRKGDESDYAGSEKDARLSERLSMAINSLSTVFEWSEDISLPFISKNRFGRLCMRIVRVPPYEFKPIEEGYGYIAPEDSGGARDAYLFRRLMHHIRMSGRKRKPFDWGISKREQNNTTQIRRRASISEQSSPMQVAEDVDETPVTGLKDRLTIRESHGDKNVNNPLRKAFEDIIRSIHRVLIREIGDDRQYETCEPILVRANNVDSKVARSLVSMTAQILIRARREADAVRKTRSQQSCLTVGMVILHHIAKTYIQADSAAKRNLELALKSFDIQYEPVSNEYSPAWLGGVIKTFDDLIEFDKTAEIYYRFYSLTYLMFIMWARFDRISFKPEEVEVKAIGAWIYLKATTKTGAKPSHPLGVPDALVVFSAKSRVPYTPWVAALFIGIFNGFRGYPGPWRYFLLALAVCALLLDLFRRYVWGTTRRPTWSLPPRICEIVERRGLLSKARELWIRDSSKLILCHRDLASKGSFARCLKKLIGVNARMSHAVSFRGALLEGLLHIEDLRAKAGVMIKIRIAKDAYKSHLNYIQVCRGAERMSWHDSAGFIYATKSIYELVVYDEWVLSIPFY